MPSPLPILIGVGLLFLVASGGSAKAATPVAPPGPAKPSAYDLGYKAGYADGLANKAKLPSSTEAAASGNAVDYAKGYADGYAKGILDKKPVVVPPVYVPPVTVDPTKNCVGPGVTMTLLEAQEILFFLGFFKGARDGKCAPDTKAALIAYQTSKMLLTAVMGTLDVITEAALRTEKVSTPTGFTNAANAFNDGLNLKTSKAPTDSQYTLWFSKGRFERGYQDQPGGTRYNTGNQYYDAGWEARAKGESDVQGWNNFTGRSDPTLFPY